MRVASSFLQVCESKPSGASRRRHSHSALQRLAQQQLFSLLFWVSSPPPCFEAHLAEAALPEKCSLLKAASAEGRPRRREGQNALAVSEDASTSPTLAGGRGREDCRSGCAFLSSNAATAGGRRDAGQVRELAKRLTEVTLVDSACLSPAASRAVLACLGNFSLLLPEATAGELSLLESRLLLHLREAVEELRSATISIQDEDRPIDEATHAAAASAAPGPRVLSSLFSSEVAARLAVTAEAKVEQWLGRVLAFVRSCGRSGDACALLPAVEAALSVLHLRVLVAAAKQEGREAQTEDARESRILPDVPSKNCTVPTASADLPRPGRLPRTAKRLWPQRDWGCLLAFSLQRSAVRSSR